MGYSEADVQRVVEHALEHEIDKGVIIHHVANWKRQYRERVLENEREAPGYIARSVRAANREEEIEAAPAMPEGGRALRELEDPRRCLRRLYDAKVKDLERIGGYPKRERMLIAVDYACGEIHRCDVSPFPAGGLPQLEDELCAAVGFERHPAEA